MIKKSACYLIGLFVCLLMAACGEQTGVSDSAGGTIQGSENGKDGVSAMELDFDYVYETDDQTDCSVITVYTENGIYTTMSISDMEKDLSGSLLMFYDYETGRTVPVCGKPDCSHEEVDCNAYFSEPEYMFTYLYFYEDHLFVRKEENGYLIMEQISLDGAEREKSCQLYRTMVDTRIEDDGTIYSSSYYPIVIIHRGYAYFSTYYANCEECELYRVRLGSDENAELLCRQEGEQSMIYRLKGYGRYVFFQKGTCLEDGTNDISVYAWDTQEDKMIEVVEGVLRNYTVGGNYLYYFDFENRDSVMQYNLLTGEHRMILDSGGQEAPSGTEIFVRDGKLYYTTPDEQKVFDEEGNLEATLKGDDMISPY